MGTNRETIMTNKLNCDICSFSFDESPSLLFFHHESCGSTLCDECFKNWKKSLSYIGWKTADCYRCESQIIINDELLNLLTDEEKEDFYYHQATQIEISNDEKWLTCAFCDYKEIGDFDDAFLLCKNPSCSQLTCLICHKTISYSPDHILPFKSLKSNQTYIKSMIENINEEIKIHEKCSEYSHLIFKIEKELEDSTSRKCPNCNYRGRKDENCTHIYCESCGHSWCYICLQKIDEYHNSSKNSASGYFSEFCPMYMYNICEIRSSWPGDSDEALAKFHRHLALYQLNNLYNSLNDDEKYYFESIEEDFPQVLNGFSVSEICAFNDYIFRE